MLEVILCASQLGVDLHQLLKGLLYNVFVPLELLVETGTPQLVLVLVAPTDDYRLINQY